MSLMGHFRKSETVPGASAPRGQADVTRRKADMRRCRRTAFANSRRPATRASDRGPPYPLGRGLALTPILMTGTPSKRANFQTFLVTLQRRGFDNQRHDFTTDGLPADEPPSRRPGTAAAAQRIVGREHQGGPLYVTNGPPSGLGRVDVEVPYAELGAGPWLAGPDIRAAAPGGSADVVRGRRNCRL